MNTTTANNNCFLWFHQWSKWTPVKVQFEVTVHRALPDGKKVEPYIEARSMQIRTCERCGLTQRKAVDV